MPLFARALGIIHSPRATLEAVARAPLWAGVLVLTFAVTTGCTAILLETDVGQLALLDQWERTASAFGQDIDDIQYAAMEDASQNGVVYAAVSSFVSGPLFTVGLSVACFVVFRASRAAGRVAKRPDEPVLAGRSVSADRPDPPVLAGRSAFADRAGAVTYRHVLAVVAHAGVILALRQVIAVPLAYARETLASPMTMGMFFGMLDEASLPARFLGIIDLFVLWWIMVLAVGMSVLYQRPARRLAAVFVGAYLALAVVLAVAMAVTGGTV
ncbi:MAG: hypothetical protein HYX77_02675 [Acidobacteria bacterium]|nr:hypothetical protein [Acidobacteriota bacterium]